MSELADLPVLDLAGTPVPLRELWAGGDTLLVWVRHFGWLFCKEQVASLVEDSPRLAAEGIRVVVIGNGAVHFAQAFAGKHAKTLPLYTDPSLKTYDALGARRGILSAVDPRVHLRAAAVLAKGFRQSATKGAALQQGGALGVTKDGAVWFRQISNHAGDHFRTEDVLTAHRSRAPG